MSTDTKQQSALEEAQAIVYGRGEADYGHPYDDYVRTSRLWEAFLGLKEGTIGPRRAAVMMVLVKCSREAHRPKRDNRVDIAGYAECVDRIDQREKELHEKLSHGLSAPDKVTWPHPLIGSVR